MTGVAYSLRARPATPVDSDALLRWRNDLLTVAFSRESALVGGAEHAAWLERTLAAPDRVLMVVEDDVGHAGTYRLDGAGSDEVEVSLTVAPERRRQHLATPVILLASLHAVVLGASEVVAHVHEDNAASIRAFFRAGYVLQPLPRGPFRSWSATRERIAAMTCPLCARGVPHHTNAVGSISGADGRAERWDLHAVDDVSGVRLEECRAGDALLRWAAARRRMLEGRKG